MTIPRTRVKSLSWEIVENAINEEIKWLKETILEFPNLDNRKDCKSCIYRNLAIKIVSGKIKAREIKSSISLFGKNKSFLIGKPHGKEWHSETMKLIATYFESLGYDITIEPNLNMGRADVGVYKNGKRNLFIEVGTTSLPKLLHNLTTMEGTDFLLVIDSKHAVEFSILKASSVESNRYH